jgi:hypothetical protein
MVEDKVWDEATTPEDTRELFCVGCLELRLGRLLTKDDFSDAPLNQMPFWPRSEKLLTRLKN